MPPTGLATGPETAAPIRAPRAVLLDHGGVLIRSTKHPERLRDVAERVQAMVRPAGELDVEDILADIVAGKETYRAWKGGNGRRGRPREIRHRELWEDFIATDWPESARALVGAEATPLCRALITAESDRVVAPGMLDVLRFCRDHGVAAGIVSNTLVGALNREFATVTGTAPYLAVQVYSDEVGIRKPDPEAILLATRALGLDPADCWYVGDNYDRDVVCGRRAGVGRAILMRPPERLEPRTRPQPDSVVSDGHALLGLLRSAFEPAVVA